MKFIVEHVSKEGGRLGRLTGLRSQLDSVYETPLSLISTLGGSAPHLTQVWRYITLCSEQVETECGSHGICCSKSCGQISVEEFAKINCYALLSRV